MAALDPVGFFPIQNNLSVFLLHWDNSSAWGWWGFTSGHGKGHRQAEIIAASSNRPEDVHESFGSSIPLTWFNNMSVILKYKNGNVLYMVLRHTSALKESCCISLLRDKIPTYPYSEGSEIHPATLLSQKGLFIYFLICCSYRSTFIYYLPPRTMRRHLRTTLQRKVSGWQCLQGVRRWRSCWSHFLLLNSWVHTQSKHALFTTRLYSKVQNVNRISTDLQRFIRPKTYGSEPAGSS